MTKELASDLNFNHLEPSELGLAQIHTMCHGRNLLFEWSAVGSLWVSVPLHKVAFSVLSLPLPASLVSQ